MHEQLRKWMKARGKNSPLVAREMNLSDGHIYNLINRKSPITVDFLIQFEWRYGKAEVVEAFGKDALVERWGQEVADR